jgi:hypothetical protein
MSQSHIQHSADLILKLYELRRDPALREARHWFATKFRPQSAAEMLALHTSSASASAHMRMVTSYWEMACAMVNHGAIDGALFARSTGEYIGFFAQIEPHLEELRAMVGDPDLFKEWEQTVRAAPGAAEKLVALRGLFAGWTEVSR